MPARYSHVIVDEAQDLTIFQLRAAIRRADGLTLVGDDAQRRPGPGLGLRRAAELLDVPLDQMDTAYRMSAEIAEWLNRWARDPRHRRRALGGHPPDRGGRGRPPPTPTVALADLRRRWENVARIDADDVWGHKGVEYDAVVVDARRLDPAEVYLAASRAAHELVLVGAPA